MDGMRVFPEKCILQPSASHALLSPRQCFEASGFREGRGGNVGQVTARAPISSREHGIDGVCVCVG